MKVPHRSQGKEMPSGFGFLFPGYAVCLQQAWAGDVAAHEQVCFVCPGLSNKHVGMCFPPEAVALVTRHST